MRTRLPDWPERLAAYLAARSVVPFRWGSNDCCSFTAGAVEAMTGDMVMSRLPEYNSGLGALLVGRRQFGKANPSDPYHVEKWPEHMSFGPLPSVNFAGRGDIVSAQGLDGRIALGVLAGVKAAFPGGNGLVWKPFSDCLRAWRV